MRAAALTRRALVRQAGVSCDALTSRFITEFHTDLAALRCLPPCLEPRATAHVPDIVALIERILANGHAYVLPGGDVYFEVATLPAYGRLSGRVESDNRAGERVAVDSRKRSAADFALWKARHTSVRLRESCAHKPSSAERQAGRAVLAVALGRRPTGVAHRVQRDGGGAAGASH